MAHRIGEACDFIHGHTLDLPFDALQQVSA